MSSSDDEDDDDEGADGMPGETYSEEDDGSSSYNTEQEQSGYQPRH